MAELAVAEGAVIQAGDLITVIVSPPSTVTTVNTYCDRCGEPAHTGDHEACHAARQMEPPRYCSQCRRRLIVQVTPTGWTARCSQHGALAAADS